MINERKAANALAGKIVRPCDGCSGKRARWFCAADDAFLCRSCAESVHSANQLARRHERVRLESVVSPPAWLQGFNRKARTPRHKNNKSLLAHQQLEHEEEFLMNPLLLVPEIGNEEESNIVADEDEDQVPCRFPVFDPFAAELCVDDMITSEGTEIAAMGNEKGNVIFDDSGHGGTASDLDNLHEFLPSDMDLGEFAADIENLLGSGLEDSSPDTKASRVLDSKDEGDEKFSYEYKVVKVKDEQDQPEAIFDWDFNYESPITVEEMNGHGNKKEMKRNVFLRLNYEAIINAWASHGSPWTSGPRPELNPDGCWPHCMGMCCNARGRHPYVVGVGGGAGGGNAGREARVLRYKEKRRTRLFSKKIRYEVRRLNAEKRPRMKGRFVKRTSFMGTAFPYINR